MKNLTFLDFFAGIGTIRIGFEQAGWTCNGHIEWDKYARQSYNAMHDIKDGEYDGQDIRAVRAADLPRSDLWAFGAPCQDFSMAGNRHGMGGERSSLVKEIFRLVKETPEEDRPQWLLYENVKGMLSSNGGWDFLGIILEMDELGYDVEWQVLNSKDFGVPQNRERVFTIGHLRGRGGRKILPITGQGGQPNENDGIKFLNKPTFSRAEISDVCQTLKARDYKGPAMAIESGIKVAGNLPGTNFNQNKTVYNVDGIAPTLRTPTGGGNESAKIVIPVSSPDSTTKNQNSRRFKEDGDPMSTPTAQDRHGVAILRPKIIDDQGRIKDSYKQHDIVPTLRAQTHGNPPKVIEGEPMHTPTAQDRHGVAIRETADGFHLCRNDAKKSSIQGTHVTYPDGTSHCLTSAHTPMTIDQLDGPKIIEDFYKNREPREYENTAPTLRSDRHGLKVIDALYYNRPPREYEDAAPTIRSSHDTLKVSDGFRIRKLTPKECWRLQGVPDEYFYKAEAAGVSNSQLYKQAGNACTVNVIYAIARALGDFNE